MVQVYLPLGYPTLSGEVDQLLIYQGNVVRLYTVPTDPRTEAQLFERKFFADLIKMRSTLGPKGRGALKAALGLKWGTVLYQLAKLDYQSYWSEASDAWDELSSTDKDDWRATAPYQATFNDPGEVFFVLSRFIYYLLIDYTGVSYGASLWAGNQAMDALEWGQQELGGYGKGQYDSTHTGIEYTGAWMTGSSAWFIGGSEKSAYPVASQKVYFYAGTRFVKFWYTKRVGQSVVEIYIDGVKKAEANQNLSSGGPTYQQYTIVDMGYKGLHYVELRGLGVLTWCVDAFDLS